MVVKGVLSSEHVDAGEAKRTAVSVTDTRKS